MAYEQGLSGLSAAANDLDVIGNNIANADTVGFKSSTAQFADVYANTLATTVNTAIGLGTSLASVSQDFSQGTINTTGQALDVAINGSGFFQMSNNGTLTYTRDGEFQLNAQGYIVNSSGLNLMGYAADASGVINTAETVPLKVSTTNIAPLATSNITAQLNLDAQDTTPTDTFSATDAASYNYQSSITTYDSLGGTNTVDMYFVDNGAGAAANGDTTWTVYAGTSGNVTSVGTVTFDSSGNLVSSTDANGNATSTLGQLSVSVTPTDGSSAQTINLNLAGTTQYGSASGVNDLAQDGYASGSLTSFSISADGTITGTYSNSQTETLGQVVLANFNDPNGLEDLGGNQYAQTSESGAAQISAPGDTNHGTLTGGAVEESNVDLTNQLVDLITAQRNYQANAQTIKTQQTVDQTLLQM